MDRANLTLKDVSYLRARDPSILSFNFPQLSQVRTNLLEEFDVTAAQKQETEKFIRVYLRIKKCDEDEKNDLYEIEGKTLISKVPPESKLIRNVKEGDFLRRMHTFSEIFDSGTCQKDLFHYVVKPKILDFINGQNSTLLTYGASGSGKTFTVIGTDEDPGLVPRALQYLFRTLPGLSLCPPVKPLPNGEVSLLNESDYKKERLQCTRLLNTLVEKTQHAEMFQAMQARLSCEPVALLEETKVSVGVWVSYAEIYNEQIYDLLKPEVPRGSRRPRLCLGRANGQTYIKDLTLVSVTSAEEAYQILQRGIHNLNYAPTQLNTHSSRSHSIFTMKLVQMSLEDGGCFVSSFNFVDLAGSERSKKTQNVGDRLKESNNINSSLLVLGRCISGVRDFQRQKEKPIPFRESKLTQLFQKALSGNEDIAMIVNISPARNMFDESQHALNFSAIAKNISVVQQQEPGRKKKNRFSRLVEKIEEISSESESEVEELRNALRLVMRQLEDERNEHAVNEKLNRDYLIDGYKDIIKEMEEYMNKQLESKEKYFKLQLHRMKVKYERQMKELAASQNVIEISSSESDGESCVQGEKVLYDKTLEQGISDYRELQAKYKLLVDENARLKDELSEVQSQLESYKQQVLSLVHENDLGSEPGSKDFKPKLFSDADEGGQIEDGFSDLESHKQHVFSLVDEKDLGSEPGSKDCKPKLFSDEGAQNF